MFYLYYMFSKNNNEFQNTMRNNVVENLKWDGIDEALDIGTGAGALAITLAKQFPNSKIYAIDTWRRGWDYSKKKCENNAHIENVSDRVEIKKASALEIPFNDGYFDAVVSNYVFHEVRAVKDRTIVIKEALRVLKKGGVFSFQDLFKKEKIFGKIDDLIDKIKHWDIDEVYFKEPLNDLELNKFLKFYMGKSGLICGKK